MFHINLILMKVYSHNNSFRILLMLILISISGCSKNETMPILEVEEEVE